MSVYKIRIHILISPAHVSPNLKPNSVPQIRPLPHSLRTPSIDFISIFLFVKTQHLKLYLRLPLLLQISFHVDSSHQVQPLLLADTLVQIEEVSLQEAQVVKDNSVVVLILLLL